MDKVLSKIKKIIPKKLFRTLQPFYHFLLSFVSAAVYRWPSEEIIVVGITGTTGKTTSVYIAAKMLEGAGYKVGYTSTAMFNDGKKEWLNDKKMTMVGRFFTQRILRQMVNNGCQYAIVETTSEGIRQYRHKFINYDILIFTGLYPEHIDSHGGFENYKKAKGELFKHLKGCKVKYANSKKEVVKSISSEIKKIDLEHIKKTIIANGDDQYVDYFLNFWAEEKIIYKEKKAQSKGDNNIPNEIDQIVYYGNKNESGRSTDFVVDSQEVHLQLLGGFNITNALNAYCLGISQGAPFDVIKRGLEGIRGVAGRLEKIDEGQDFIVIVDYAFEPKALSKLYETVDLIPHQKIIHVLGSAGGGRDIARRPQLGELAGQKADYVIITNEDPYDDNPDIIIDQVALGAERAGKVKGKDMFKILDRREAIKKAIILAEKEDLVLITGKGSEQAICISNGEKIPWDDRLVTRELLKEAKLKCG